MVIRCGTKGMQIGTPYLFARFGLYNDVFVIAAAAVILNEDVDVLAVLLGRELVLAVGAVPLGLLPVVLAVGEGPPEMCMLARVDFSEAGRQWNSPEHVHELVHILASALDFGLGVLAADGAVDVLGLRRQLLEADRVGRAGRDVGVGELGAVVGHVDGLGGTHFG
jgi:hypothetical protein